MHTLTSRYLDGLRSVARKRLPAWKKRYPNVVGVHVGNKRRAGTYKRYFSIVFHVTQKTRDLPLKERIPRRLSLVVPGFGRRSVPTDVIGTGTLDLHTGHVAIGDKARPVDFPDFGTVSCFLKRNDKLYALSNMHVLGARILSSGTRAYYLPVANQTVADVELFSTGSSVLAYLERGIFSGIDAAIARLPDHAEISNCIPERGAPAGYVELTNASYRTFRVRLHGSVSPERNTTVRAIGVFKSSAKYGMTIDFNNLIMLNSVVTQGGDSGAPVFDSGCFIVGIVVGSDDEATYVLPITDLLVYFEARLVSGAGEDG